MNGNKTVKVKKETSKVKEFVKKNGKYVFVGAMCGLTYSVGYLVCRHKYINNTFTKHLSYAVNGGDMYYCENSLATNEINTVKGLINEKASTSTVETLNNKVDSVIDGTTNISVYGKGITATYDSNSGDLIVKLINEGITISEQWLLMMKSCLFRWVA